jgi:hypothetical protein
MTTKTKLLLTGLSFVILTSFSLLELPETFTELLDRAKMAFDKPKGLVETDPIENGQMNYEYALITENKDFEVRYAIRPLDELISKYNEDKKNGKPGVAVHPNKLYSAAFEATVLNISGGQFPEPTIFDSEAVKEEFNADWGATNFIEVGKEFGQNYKYCVVVAIHKDNIGDAYCFYLSKTTENISSNMEKLFHQLKFK